MRVTADDHDWLAERFEEHRTHLRAVAYRLLGSVNDATWVAASLIATSVRQGVRGRAGARRAQARSR